MFIFIYEFWFLLVGCLKKILSYDNKFYYFYVYVKRKWDIYILYMLYYI